MLIIFLFIAFFIISCKKEDTVIDISGSWVDTALNRSVYLSGTTITNDTLIDSILYAHRFVFKENGEFIFNSFGLIFPFGTYTVKGDSVFVYKTPTYITNIPPEPFFLFKVNSTIKNMDDNIKNIHLHKYF